MRNRRHTLLWMKDLIEHMGQCHDQLQWTSDRDTETFLAETLLGDLDQCQKLCEQLRTGPVHAGGSPPARHDVGARDSIARRTAAQGTRFGAVAMGRELG